MAIIESLMVSTPEGFSDNSQISSSQSVTVKIPVQENYSIIFRTCYKSNLWLLSSGFVPLNKSAKKSELALCCDPVYLSNSYIQKSINRLKSSLKFHFTESLGYGVSISNYCLKLSIGSQVEPQLFTRFHCRYFSESHIIALWVHQKRVDLKSQDMQTIISSSVIKLCTTFYHPN